MSSVSTTIDTPTDSPVPAAGFANGNPIAAAGSSIGRPIVAARSSNGISNSEHYYLLNNQSNKILVALCRGLITDDGEQVLDAMKAPWKYMTPASALRPRNGDYVNEVDRRWNVYFKDSALGHGMVAPRSKGWNTDRLLKWLDDHPIIELDDVGFLMKTVALKKNILGGNRCQKAEKELLEKSWVGKYPYLRLIHCLIESDEIKNAFLHRNDVDNTRMTVDNRNSVEKRRTTVWEMIAREWNDPLFQPITEELPDLHSDFSCEDLIEHALVCDMTPATAEKCQKKFAGMMVELGRIIRDWEKSGQGDGGLEDDANGDDDGDQDRNGALRNRSSGALGCRSNFIQFNQSYLLYLWHMLDKYDLLKTSLSLLDDSVCAGNGAFGVPSVILDRDNTSADGGSSVLGNIQEESNSLLYKHLNDLGEKTETAARLNQETREKTHQHEQALLLQQRIYTLKDKKRTLAVEILQNKRNKEMFDLLTEQMDDIKQESESCEVQLSRYRETSNHSEATTPQRHNRTPDSAIQCQHD